MAIEIWKLLIHANIFPILHSLSLFFSLYFATLSLLQIFVSLIDVMFFYCII